MLADKFLVVVYTGAGVFGLWASERLHDYLDRSWRLTGHVSRRRRAVAYLTGVAALACMWWAIEAVIRVSKAGGF